jgi:spermidine dehydrogenase
MAGLSAAYFYRKQIPGAKILVLDGCDDFGGHARRVEFDVDGRQLLVCGGTEEIWNPNTFSPESLRLLEDIGIDRERYYRHAKGDPDPIADLGLKQGVFFDEETFGVDRLVTGRPSIRGSTAAQWREYFDRTPVSDGLKEGFIKLHTDTTDYMAGMPVAEKVLRFRKMSFADYLGKVAKIHPDTIAYLVRNGSGDGDNQSAGPETYSAWYAWRRGQRGFAGLGLPPASQGSNLTTDPGENVAFPDGNAGVARLLVRWMIPDALPGKTAEDSIPGRLDYDRLDRSSNEVRIRLSSTVVRVTHLGDPLSAREVEITYVRGGRPYRVRAKAAVMACFNAIIPYIVPDLPEHQRTALRMALRKPLVRIFVAIRNWTAFQELGVSGVLCPGMFHQ